ncbi:MAG: hypothetical protein ABIV63_00420, partial [Caldimonas sp.]
ARGELDRKRIRKCRSAALDAMPGARRRQKPLADLVEQRRRNFPEARADVEALLDLSLHCRAAIAALAPTVDRRAAESLGNRILLELRSATLAYLATFRDGGDGDSTKPRAAVVDLLTKAETHASGLLNLAPGNDATGAEASLGVALSRDVAEGIHRACVAWTESAHAAAATPPHATGGVHG